MAAVHPDLDGFSGFFFTANQKVLGTIAMGIKA